MSFHKQNKLLWLTSVFIWCMQIHFWLESSEISDILLFDMLRTVCFYIAFMCVAVKWIADARINFFSLIIVVVSSGIMFLSLINSQGMTFAKLILFGLALKGIEYRWALKVFVKANTSIAALIIGAALLGLIENQKGYDGETVYYFLGFKNPNTAALMLFTIFIGYICINFKRISGLKIFNLLIVTIFIYKITNSRSALIVMILSCALLMFDKYIYKVSKLFGSKAFRAIVYSIFPLFSFLSYTVAHLYTKNELVNKLNVVFSYRFALWHWHTELLSIKPFGAPSTYEELGTMDNSYLVILYQYGFLIWMLYFLIFFGIYKLAIKKNDVAVCLIAIAYEVYFLTEGYPFFINTNIVLLFFLTEFWNIKLVVIKKRRKKDAATVSNKRCYSSI